MPLAIKADQLIAHRGHQEAFPENSLLAILDAIAAGASAIEFDIQLSKDGIPMLFHDENMERICGKDSGVGGKIVDYTAEELAQYHACEPKRLGKRFKNNPINKLEDIVPLFTQHPHIQFFLELKEESLSHFGRDMCFMALRKAIKTLPNNLVYISFDLLSVKQAKQEGFDKTALVFRNWVKRNELLAEADADYGLINYTRIPVKEAIEADRPIMVYEVKHAFTGQQLLERGAKAVETFHIRTLLLNK